MARRESEYLFARRFAARGNDKSVFYSRARGEDQSSTRRFAARGSGRVDPDPWNLKIKRLRQRVRYLEIKHEIRRLRQRIQDLKLKRDMCKTETEASTVVWDEGGDREQHPFNRHPNRFSEPTYPDFLSEGGPKFDKDESEVDEEEYLWAQRAIVGVTNHDDEEEKAIKHHENSSISSIATGGEVVDLEVACNLMERSKGLNFESHIALSPKNVDFQIGKQISVSHDKDQVYDNDVCMGPMHESFIRGPCNPNGKSSDMHEKISGFQFSCQINTFLVVEQTNIKKHLECRNVGELAYHLVANMYSGATSPRPNVNDGPLDGVARACKSNGPFSNPSINHKRNPKIKFNLLPGATKGGTCPELGKVIHEVEVFMRDVLIINRDRVDVPFDPGGFDWRQNSRTSFFEDEEYDAGLSPYSNFISLVYVLSFNH